MKIYNLILFGLTIISLSCERDPNYSLLLTNGNTKSWRLDSISLDGAGIMMVSVDYCTADDKYTFKSNNLVLFDNSGTKYDYMISPWTGCLDTIIKSEQNWKLDRNILIIGKNTYEILKINHKQMILMFHKKNQPKPAEYQIYSPIE